MVEVDRLVGVVFKFFGLEPALGDECIEAVVDAPQRDVGLLGELALAEVGLAMDQVHDGELGVLLSGFFQFFTIFYVTKAALVCVGWP